MALSTDVVEEARRSGSSTTGLGYLRIPPAHNLQHRLEVLALAADGEESCPMEGRPFQHLQAQRCWRLPHRVFPSLLESEYAKSSGTSGFAPAWGVHHCPSLQASEGGSSYGSRGRPPDTTGRAVPLTGFPRGFLEEGSRPHIAAAHSPAVGPTSTRTMDQQHLRAQLLPHLPRTTAIGSTAPPS
ncbi:hypothetical protein THAOC_28726 [Thalassiosira oceanica]|uniref:Uncharacterized protein n=1 Tax=Thalassiosira oceanica TaxID=159749 RepID=K0RID7_THAOC|nr:hypothetical protein THAOC_28726 [Thalassiosira oceanica]|eukprot:EJK52044.1 hypothetical protein THAOC_28726 [Thalassiosira oceanica]